MSKHLRIMHTTEYHYREPEKAAPISGSWDGPDGAFDRMEVIVRLEAV